VFNSYGRRPNDNLLLDYGFAIENNEWEEVQISVGIDPENDRDFDQKNRALFGLGYAQHRAFPVRLERALWLNGQATSKQCTFPY
jgi:hypothetical protein